MERIAVMQSGGFPGVDCANEANKKERDEEIIALQVCGRNSS